MKPNSTTFGRLARPSLTVFFANIWQWVLICHQRHRERAHLATLDERALKDIGVSRVDAWREWRKPFWKA